MNFRTDLSPFLVHLTRTNGTDSARTCLEMIITEMSLMAGSSLVSHASFGLAYARLQDPDLSQYFKAVCLTETPLDQIHCLLEIENRDVNLEPYGLVFLRRPLQERGVAPVIYLNNERGDKPALIRALAEMVDQNQVLARQILPFVAVFGSLLPPGGEGTPRAGRIDFLWEREWRWPAFNGNLQFSHAEVFLGLCPHEDIDHFEALFPPIRFVDPRRNMRWYSSQLIEMRQRLDLTQSVV